MSSGGGLHCFSVKAFLLLLCAAVAQAANPIVVLETSKGVIKIELLEDEAPKTVANFLTYVELRYYDDTVFHRVMPKFVVQGGGFTPELEVKPTLPPVPIETKNKLTNDRGTLAMARTVRLRCSARFSNSYARRNSPLPRNVAARVARAVTVVG